MAKTARGALKPHFEDVQAHYDPLTNAPNRLLWGSDWPHPQYFKPMPNDVALLDQYVKVRGGTLVPGDALLDDGELVEAGDLDARVLALAGGLSTINGIAVDPGSSLTMRAPPFWYSSTILRS